MELTILGSGGCMVIPKPLCQCSVCKEARRFGPPFERTGPSAFIHDENVLIDTPAEIGSQLNRNMIGQIDYLLYTHLDPDHIEGFRIVEQVALDFRSWEAYPQKRIKLFVPQVLEKRLRGIQTAYGSQLAYYEKQGFIECVAFGDQVKIGSLDLSAIPVDRGDQIAFIYVFEKNGRKLVYAPCDIKPFPQQDKRVKKPDLLVIQPGLFETGLKHGFVYPQDHISRQTLYTFEQTLNLSRSIGAKQTVFVHLEEYWNRSHSDYLKLEYEYQDVCFAYDGMQVRV